LGKRKKGILDKPRGGDSNRVAEHQLSIWETDKRNKRLEVMHMREKKNPRIDEKITHRKNPRFVSKEWEKKGASIVAVYTPGPNH